MAAKAMHKAIKSKDIDAIFCNFTTIIGLSVLSLSFHFFLLLFLFLDALMAFLICRALQYANVLTDLSTKLYAELQREIPATIAQAKCCCGREHKSLSDLRMQTQETDECVLDRESWTVADLMLK